MKYSKEEVLKAIQIIKDLNNEKYRLYDHFYSGDSDTLDEALENVLESKGVDSESVEWDSGWSDRDYFSTHRSEIVSEGNRLVKFGNKMKKFHSEINKFLDDLTEEYLNNN